MDGDNVLCSYDEYNFKISMKNSNQEIIQSREIESANKKKLRKKSVTFENDFYSNKLIQLNKKQSSELKNFEGISPKRQSNNQSYVQYQIKNLQNISSDQQSSGKFDNIQNQNFQIIEQSEDSLQSQPKSKVSSLVKKSILFSNKSTIKNSFDELTPNDFEYLEMLGQGAYGQVHKVCMKRNRYSKFALKELSKAHILKYDKAQSVVREKDILMNLIDIPFFVQFECTFQSEDKLFFLIEYISNGTLQDYINSYKKIPLKACKQIAARLVVSLEVLYQKNIAHRDFKPQNILFNQNYETKICDFGEAKIITGLRASAINKEFSRLHRQKFPDSDENSLSVDSEENEDPFEQLFEEPNNEMKLKNCKDSLKASGTFVGTAHYTAPEMLLNNTSGPFSDLWALGIIIYQMIKGEVPWKGETSPMIFQEILSRDVDFGNDMTPESVDLIDRLLQLQPFNRLGAGKQAGDFKALKSHKFFDGIDFEVIEKGNLCYPIPPPPQSHLNQNTLDPFLDFQQKSLGRNPSRAKIYDKNGNRQTLENENDQAANKKNLFESPENSPKNNEQNSEKPKEVKLNQLQRVPTMREISSIADSSPAKNSLQPAQNIQSDLSVSLSLVSPIQQRNSLENDQNNKNKNQIPYLKQYERRRDTAGFPGSSSNESPFKNSDENDKTDIKQKFEMTLREEQKKHQKIQAKLNQQIEILTLQLKEASDREQNLKKTHQSVVQALNTRISSPRIKNLSEKDIRDKEKEIDKLKQKMHDIQEQDNEKFNSLREKIHDLELKLIDKNQIILEKENEILRLKQQEQSNSFISKNIEHIKKEYEQIMDEKENYFIERQQRLNSNILTYQKDLNKANDKIETYIQNERAKNFKINEQEQQIKILNQKFSNLQKNYKQLIENQQNQEEYEIQNKKNSKHHKMKSMSSHRSLLNKNQRNDLLSPTREVEENSNESSDCDQISTFNPPYAEIGMKNIEKLQISRQKTIDVKSTKQRTTSNISYQSRGKGSNLDTVSQLSHGNKSQSKFSVDSKAKQINFTVKVDDQDIDALLRDAGDNIEQRATILGRLVAMLRSKISKNKIKIKEMKEFYDQKIKKLQLEIQKLNEKAQTEFSENFEKRKNLMQKLEQRDLQIINLKQQQAENMGKNISTNESRVNSSSIRNKSIGDDSISKRSKSNSRNRFMSLHSNIFQTQQSSNSKPRNTQTTTQTLMIDLQSPIKNNRNSKYHQIQFKNQASKLKQLKESRVSIPESQQPQIYKINKNEQQKKQNSKNQTQKAQTTNKKPLIKDQIPNTIVKQFMSRNSPKKVLRYNKNSPKKLESHQIKNNNTQNNLIFQDKKKPDNKILNYSQQNDEEFENDNENLAEEDDFGIDFSKKIKPQFNIPTPCNLKKPLFKQSIQSTMNKHVKLIEFDLISNTPETPKINKVVLSQKEKFEAMDIYNPNRSITSSIGQYKKQTFKNEQNDKHIVLEISSASKEITSSFSDSSGRKYKIEKNNVKKMQQSIQNYQPTANVDLKLKNQKNSLKILKQNTQQKPQPSNNQVDKISLNLDLENLHHNKKTQSRNNTEKLIVLKEDNSKSISRTQQYNSKKIIKTNVQKTFLSGQKSNPGQLINRQVKTNLKM